MGWSDFFDALRSHMDNKENMSINYQVFLKENNYRIRPLIFFIYFFIQIIHKLLFKMNYYVNSPYHIAVIRLLQPLQDSRLG